MTSPTDTQTLMRMIIFERHFVTFEYSYDFLYLICETDRDIWNDTSVFIDCKNIIYHREHWIITYLGWIGTGFLFWRLPCQPWEIWWSWEESGERFGEFTWGRMRLAEVRRGQGRSCRVERGRNRFGDAERLGVVLWLLFSQQ